MLSVVNAHQRRAAASKKAALLSAQISTSLYSIGITSGHSLSASPCLDLGLRQGAELTLVLARVVGFFDEEDRSDLRIGLASLQT